MPNTNARPLYGLTDWSNRTVHLSHDTGALFRYARQEGLAQIAAGDLTRADLARLQALGYGFAAFPDVEAAAFGLVTVST